MRKGQLGSVLVFFCGILLGVTASVAQDLGHWEELAPMPSSRQEVGVGLIGGKVYVIGGLDETGRAVKTVERYSPDTDTWESVAPLPAPQPLSHVGVASLHGKLFVIGGLRQDFSPVDSVFCFDPETEQWSQKASLPEPRGAMGIGVVKGRIYAAGGLPVTRGRQFTVYDPDSDAWSALPDMPTNRNHLAGVGLGGRFYAFGGRALGVLRSATEVYDPVTGVWSTLAPMPTARGGLAAAVAGGRTYVFGGEGNPDPGSEGVFREVEEYDPLTDSWQALAEMPEGRHGIGAASYQGRVFIPGGGPSQGASVSNRNDAFSPPGPTAITFDGAPFLGPLTGEFGGIDWGTSGWLTFGGSFGPCQGPLAISVRSLTSFRFVQPAILDSFDVGSPAFAGTLVVISLDSLGNPLEVASELAGPGLCGTIQTGFTQPASEILLFFQGAAFSVDGVTYKADNENTRGTAASGWGFSELR